MKKADVCNQKRFQNVNYYRKVAHRTFRMLQIWSKKKSKKTVQNLETYTSSD